MKLPTEEQATHLTSILEHGLPDLSPSELIFYYVERSKILLTAIVEKMKHLHDDEEEETEEDDEEEY